MMPLKTKKWVLKMRKMKAKKSSHQVNTEQVVSTNSSMVENKDKDAGSNIF